MKEKTKYFIYICISILLYQGLLQYILFINMYAFNCKFPIYNTIEDILNIILIIFMIIVQYVLSFLIWKYCTNNILNKSKMQKVIKYGAFFIISGIIIPITLGWNSIFLVFINIFGVCLIAFEKICLNKKSISTSLKKSIVAIIAFFTLIYILTIVLTKIYASNMDKTMQIIFVILIGTFLNTTMLIIKFPNNKICFAKKKNIIIISGILITILSMYNILKYFEEKIIMEEINKFLEIAKQIDVNINEENYKDSENFRVSEKIYHKYFENLNLEEKPTQKFFSPNERAQYQFKRIITKYYNKDNGSTKTASLMPVPYNMPYCISYFISNMEEAKRFYEIFIQYRILINILSCFSIIFITIKEYSYCSD